MRRPWQRTATSQPSAADDRIARASDVDHGVDTRRSRWRRRAIRITVVAVVGLAALTAYGFTLPDNELCDAAGDYERALAVGRSDANVKVRLAAMRVAGTAVIRIYESAPPEIRDGLKPYLEQIMKGDPSATRDPKYKQLEDRLYAHVSATCGIDMRTK